jgi:hypothetical protein
MSENIFAGKGRDFWTLLMGVLPARDHQSCLIIPGESEEWRGGLPVV